MLHSCFLRTETAKDGISRVSNVWMEASIRARDSEKQRTLNSMPKNELDRLWMPMRRWERLV